MIYTMKDLGNFTLFSTVVLQPELLEHPERADAEERSAAYRWGYSADCRRVAAFGYCVGQRLPGTKWAATRMETNMMVAAQAVDEGIHATGLLWRIPAQTPDAFRLVPQGTPYVVTIDDVREFVGTAKIAFYSGGEKPFYELPLAARPIVLDEDDGWPGEADDEAVRRDAIGSWGQRLTDVDPYLKLARVEKFWWEVQFSDRLPKLGGPVTLICAIETKRSRGVC